MLPAKNNQVLSAICPHEGCEVVWEQNTNRFSCPCHESYFAADGSRISGPSPRGLDPLADARSGRKTASAIRLEGASDSRMTQSSRTSHSWFRRLGGTTGGIVVLLLVQFLTGVLLAFYYVPSVDHAYTTVSYIEKVVSSGSWIRSLHHYGSQWLSVFAFIHVIQLFLTNAYASNRDSMDRRDPAAWVGDGRGWHGLFTSLGRARVLQHSRC